MRSVLHCAFLLAVCACATVTQAQYIVTNLVSDGSIPAAYTDPNLVNAWGLAASPTSFIWSSNNHSGTSTLYDGNGVPQSLVVTVPGVPFGTPGSPTGMVNYGGSGFVVSNGTNSGPARFMWAAEDGSISGWNPGVPPPAPSTIGFTAVDNSVRGSVYKGLTFGVDGGLEQLYATDFHNGAVNVFNSSFGEIVTPGAFADPTLPAGYAPFGAATFNSNIYVTYALQDADAHDDVPGPGHGYVDVFSPSGTLLSRLISGGVLNSPWGMAMAPADFGELSNDLLIGNFGDGRINAFDPLTGALEGTLSDASGSPLEIGGLWGLLFGNGAHDQPTNTLYFAAGPNFEANGLYGRIDVVPEPASLFLILGAFVAIRRR
jgi:uncharacterized protein (TIGR03118 family)